MKFVGRCTVLVLLLLVLQIVGDFVIDPLPIMSGDQFAGWFGAIAWVLLFKPFGLNPQQPSQPQQQEGGDR